MTILSQTTGISITPKDKERKLFNLLLVLYPVTNIYGIGIQGLSVGKLLLLFSGLYLLLKKKSSLIYPKRYIAFALYMFIVPFFYTLSSWTDINGTIYKSTGLLVFVLILGLSCRFIRIEYLTHYFRKATLLFVAFFYLQFVVSLFTGIRILGIIPGIPLADASSIDVYFSMQSKLTRYCSVFLEPSHFAVYISMFLAFKLLFLRGKIWNRDIIFVVVALILLQSGNGYMCMLAIGVGYLIVFGRQSIRKPKRLLAIVCCIFVIGVFYKVASTSADFSDTFDRMNEIEANGDQNSSGFTRIFRGYYYFSDMEPLEKIIGIGQGNEIIYAKTHSMHNFRLLDTYNDTVYLNGLQQILVYGGIVGMLLFVYFLAQYYKCKRTILLVLPFTILFFISGVYNSSTMLLYIVFLELTKRAMPLKQMTRA